MQGDLADLPLIGVLELIHFSRKTGVLHVEAPLPFSLAFRDGEITDGGILDWVGLDAIFTLPPAPAAGQFAFTPSETHGEPLLPYARLTGDWAHLADEWPRVVAAIGSPSCVLRGNVPYYEEGRSVRAVARHTGESLFDTARRAAEHIAAGRLLRTSRRAWHVLRLRHPRSRDPQPLPPGSIERALDGQLKLGEIIDAGIDECQLRSFILREIRGGLHFPGAGWVMRDLVWEHEEIPETVA